MFSALVWAFLSLVDWSTSCSCGLDSLEAGVWSQLLLVGGLIGWLLTYAFRAVNQR